MMALARDNLWSLEEYSEKRSEFKAKVIAHKKNRQVKLSEHARLLFEDETTIRYQIQEMLRIEKVFDVAGIQDELDAYNPLIPDGDNWKATFMLEYDNVKERKKALADLIGVEDRVWLQVAGCEKVYAIADEDLERENENKTSSVHFLRFQLNEEMVKAAKTGAIISAGCDHPQLVVEEIVLSERIMKSLVGDLN